MKINKDIIKLLIVLMSNNYEAYLVGGCIRDLLIKKIPKDYDITTNATPEQIKQCFKDYKVLEIGAAFGTIIVIYKNKQYEVTTYRNESHYSDNRRPDKVSFSQNIKDDLARRDFTMNAIAYNPITNETIDIFNGIEDINNKIIRCVGNADYRFDEDALRMLRALRFAAQLEFNVHHTVVDSIRKNYKKLSFISSERIRDELNKILLSKTPSKIFKFIYESTIEDILECIHLKYLRKCINFNQQSVYHSKDVFNHILDVLDLSKPMLANRLSALFHDIGKPHCFSIDKNNQGHFYKHEYFSRDIASIIMNCLKYDNDTINNVCIIVHEHMSKNIDLNEKSIKKFINRVKIENLDTIFDIFLCDTKALNNLQYMELKIKDFREKCYEILNQKQPLSIKDLVINGNDLKEIVFVEGKEPYQTGVIQFPLKERKIIKDVKFGKVDIDKVLRLIYQLIEEIKLLQTSSKINYKHDKKFINDYLLEIYKSKLRRGNEN